MGSARAKVFFDLLESTSDANANWQIWWAIANRAKPKLLSNMNRYPEFFRATERAHFNGIFINLAHLFDRRADASSIERYLKLASTLFSSSERKIIRDRLAKFHLVRDGVLEVRNRLIAHKNVGLTERQVFQQAKLTPRQIGQLLSESVQIVDSFAERENSANRVYRGDLLADATLDLINALERHDA